MKLRLFVALVSLGLVGSVAFAQNQGVGRPLIVLVPGYFNSIIPGMVDWEGFHPYFSRTIVDTIRGRGYEVEIIDDLIPTGQVQRNGELLAIDLAKIASAHGNQPMVLIAHSAGGLYAMRALTLRPDLNVKTVVTLATPYHGIEFIENISSGVPAAVALAKLVDLQSLSELRGFKVQDILKSVVLPNQIRWIALAGEQKPCFLDCGRASKLPFILTLAQMLMTSPSDGIVTVNSALAHGVALLRQDGQPFAIEHWDDFPLPLDHWEMVSDSRIFHFFGTIDTHPIEVGQVQTYETILKRLENVRAL